MKKIASVVVMLSLFAVLFTACGSKDDNNAFIGTWNTVSIEMEGEVMEIDDPTLAMIGFDALLDYSITFNEGGKAIFAAFGMEEEVDYKADGNNVTITSGGESISFTLNGDVLAMSDDSFGGAVINFKKA